MQSFNRCFYFTYVRLWATRKLSVIHYLLVDVELYIYIIVNGILYLHVRTFTLQIMTDQSMRVLTSVPILTSTNFNNWRFRITSVLKRELCADVFEMDPPAEAGLLAKFNIKDNKAQSIIIQGISDKHLDLVKDCKTAREQVTSLKNVFIRSTSFTKLTLWRKLFELRSTSSDSLEDHFLKFDSIIRDLNDLGSKIEESDRVCHMLLSLPDKFESVITALETVPGPEVKMDFVKSDLEKNL